MLCRIFSLLSAILHLGNICYKKKTYRDDSIDICNPEVLPVVSELLEVLKHNTSGIMGVMYVIAAYYLWLLSDQPKVQRIQMCKRKRQRVLLFLMQCWLLFK